MRKLGLAAALAASVAVTGCATYPNQYGYDPYGYNNGYYNNGYYNNGRYNNGRNWDGYGNQGGSYELRQTALNAGYNEGLKAGREDRRRGRYNPTRYSNAMKDYNSRMGDRYTYQQYFIQAFQNGYADGYRGV